MILSEEVYTLVSDLTRIRIARQALTGVMTEDEEMFEVKRTLDRLVYQLSKEVDT